MMKTSNWSFSRKLLTVNLAYLLPCALLIFFLTKEKNNQVEFSTKENSGIEYSKILVRILVMSSQHKIFSESPVPEVAARAELIEGQIDHNFKELEEVDLKYGEALLFTDLDLSNRNRVQASYRALKAQWQEVAQKPEGRAANYARLYGNLIKAINHATDSSNLILDPDLDSYYLMDIITTSMPRLIESQRDLIGQVYAKISDSEQAKRKYLVELATQTHVLEDLVSHIQSGVYTTLNEDKGFYGVLASMQKELPSELKAFTATQDKLLRSLNATINTGLEGEPLEFDSDFYLHSIDALESTQVFYDQLAETLADLINIRIAKHSAERWQALVLTLLVWLIPGFLSLVTVRRLGGSFGSAVARLLSQAEAALQSSSQLAQASSVVSSGSTEQAAALQETGASMSEMASMIARTTDQASNSQQLASRVAQKAEEGCGVMEKMVLSMDSIQQANSQLQNISNIINEISNKTNMINDIVGKTQLLSFNASIEAARAGQHGRGFAVVAEEVGNLAQTSGKAAKGIRDLIDDSQKQVAHILKLTLERVADGKKVTEQAQTIFSGIASDIVLISDQVESVSEAAREQQFGIEQISKAMLQMDQTTRSNNSAAQTAALLSDQLSGQSRKLTVIAQSISKLVVGKKKASQTLNARTEFSNPNTQEALEIDSHSLMDKIVSQNHEVDPVETMSADDSSFRKVG